MKVIFVLALSVLSFAQQGSTPANSADPKGEQVVVGTFSQTDNLDAANLMRNNAEISRINESEKPLTDQLNALEKSKEPWQKEMTARIAALCRTAKVPEDAIKANQCSPRLARDKDGKDVIEILWTKPAKSDK